MKKASLFFWVVLGLVLAGKPVLAETDAGTSSVKDKHSLAVAGVGIAALEEIAKKGIITPGQSSEGSNHLLKQVSETVGRSVSANEALSARDALGTAPGETKKGGGVTFVDILWVIGIIVGVVCLLILFGRAVGMLVAFFVSIPAVVYEVLLFLGAAVLFTVPYLTHLSQDMAPFIGFTGCLVLAGGLFFTFTAHEIKISGVRFSLPLFVAWSIAAVVFQSSLIGFFAMAALMSTLGFSALMVPGCVMIGFEDDAAVARTTSAAFAVLIAFVAIHALGPNIPHIGVFKIGALYFGSFVGYLGLLIVSSKWYAKNSGHYILLQVVTIVAGFAALLFGTWLKLPELQKIGGTFFALYALEKTFEIPKKSLVGYAAVGFVIASAIFVFCWYVKAHPDTFRPYLFLV